jgi:hypothetical protein
MPGTLGPFRRQSERIGGRNADAEPRKLDPKAPETARDLCCIERDRFCRHRRCVALLDTDSLRPNCPGGGSMLNDRCFCVTLETCHGRQVLRTSTEREVALMAESVLRRYEGKAMTVGFSVEGPNPGGTRRIAFYLTDVALELELA